MKDKLIHFLWRRRTAIFAFGPIVMLLVARTSLASWLLAIPLILLGCALRFWAAGHLAKSDRVVTTGPFGYVRNPLYVGSFLVFCGVCIMTNRWDLVPIFLFLFLVFHLGAILFEERYLLEVFGEEFADYCRQVPRLIPRLIPRLTRVGEPGAFSFALACVNREPRSALGTVILVSLFGLRAAVPALNIGNELVKTIHAALSIVWGV